MGEDALTRAQRPRHPARRAGPATPGGPALTPSIDALYVPNIDEALDEEASKRAFWRAFKVLGEWYADLPPY